MSTRCCTLQVGAPRHQVSCTRRSARANFKRIFSSRNLAKKQPYVHHIASGHICDCPKDEYWRSPSSGRKFCSNLVHERFHVLKIPANSKQFHAHASQHAESNLSYEIIRTRSKGSMLCNEGNPRSNEAYQRPLNGGRSDIFSRRHAPRGLMYYRSHENLRVQTTSSRAVYPHEIDHITFVRF